MANQGEAISLTSTVVFSLGSVALVLLLPMGMRRLRLHNPLMLLLRLPRYPLLRVHRVRRRNRGETTPRWRCYRFMLHGSQMGFFPIWLTSCLRRIRELCFWENSIRRSDIWNSPNPFVCGHQQAYRPPSESNFTPVSFQQASPLVMPGYPTDYPGYMGTGPPQSRTPSTRRRAAPKQTRSAPSSKG